MLVIHNPDEFVIETTHHTCEYHKRQPWDKSYPGCTCSGSYSQRRATPEERQHNIERRKAEQERRRKHIADYDAGLIK